MPLYQSVRALGFPSWSSARYFTSSCQHTLDSSPFTYRKESRLWGGLHHTSQRAFSSSNRVVGTSNQSALKSSYQYRALGENESRLLILQPGQPNEPLRCFLEDLKTIRNPGTPYKAISYSWSEVSGLESIECDGAILSITRSAYNVLRRLRDIQKTETVWIDGICINQHDVAEKGKVVKRMRDIYASASGVIIWLEESSEEPFIDDYMRWKDSKELRTPYGFISLLKRKWFTRKWILQEAVLARPNALTVGCGYHKIPWDGEDGFANFLLDLKWDCMSARFRGVNKSKRQSGR
ncbi:heterokaryon incompatibility protein-domain-containing protein [Podospora fimiseda]|uniref:Heterokaryon incompatibility protein-domain-containing protein n=1 Tax=Podospora fimiseda TaxID=252190 RepID=A0AAN7BTD2_9PEZI|nr:heterokaryon incompatibility protein-domain-containing protein [Podospora fimiseda]